MIENTCCVTGHRNIRAARVPAIREQLEREILFAVGAGYTRFISGFAEGCDLVFADLVAEMKCDLDLKLVAALPYRNRFYSQNPMVQQLLRACDEVYVISEQCTRQCYFQRNRWMVNESGRVIALYDGRDAGGTYYTVRCAQALQRQLRVVQI